MARRVQRRAAVTALVLVVGLVLAGCFYRPAPDLRNAINRTLPRGVSVADCTGSAGRVGSLLVCYFNDAGHGGTIAVRVVGLRPVRVQTFSVPEIGDCRGAPGWAVQAYERYWPGTCRWR